jgi:predicted  nucleic acid-binding Zn-ribbon protein
MTLEKAPKQAERVNVSLTESVKEIAAKVMQARLKGDNFSELVRDLILEEYKRQASGGTKTLEQYLTEIVDLLAKVRALEAKLKEKDDRLKRERRELTEALALCEADLKQARKTNL